MRQVLGVSERRACSVFGQHRSTQRKPLRDGEDERHLTADIVELARQYGRYGYRRIHSLLTKASWDIGLSVVERVWRREGLKVPRKQPKRRRLWLNDGSCKPNNPSGTILVSTWYVFPVRRNVYEIETGSSKGLSRAMD